MLRSLQFWYYFGGFNFNYFLFLDILGLFSVWHVTFYVFLSPRDIFNLYSKHNTIVLYLIIIGSESLYGSVSAVLVLAHEFFMGMLGFVFL